MKRHILIFLLFCGTVFPQLSSDGKFYILNLGKIKLPITNYGAIYGYRQPFSIVGSYDTIPFLSSGGFLLSGFADFGLWGNGVQEGIRIGDYQPGPVGSNPDDPKNRIYLLNSYDLPFGLTWQEWKNAVELGADFYDGDGDGIYNPMDKNNNNKWDADEDRPDFLGTETIWCVYNDGVHPALRRFNNILPQGIEIHQTIFVYNVGNPLGRTIFIRYRIINKGTVADILDSVYFSSHTDPDIGEYLNDLAGSDTLVNSGYCFNAYHDSVYYLDLSFVTTLLQTPSIYKDGFSYIDINNNGMYDPGFDLTLDTAFVYKGYLGIDTLPGMSSLKITSYIAGRIWFHWGDPFVPEFVWDLRNFQLGMSMYGNYFDPCNWTYGTVTGNIPCDEVNPVFMYSGDPFNNIGWLNTFPTDQRMYVTTGPFDLYKDKPVDIIIAYSVGKGDNPLAALRDAKTSVEYSIKYHRMNYGIELPEYVDEEKPKYDFGLRYNYPNPFNSETVIEYSLKKRSHITLKVFSILGEEVATLVNGLEETGFYTIRFNPAEQNLNLPSGIYTAVLQSGGLQDVIKMVYLK